MTTAAIPLHTARARRAAAPTTPTPPGASPAMPLRTLLAPQHQDFLQQLGRRLLWVVAAGFAAIAAAVFFGLWLG